VGKPLSFFYRRTQLSGRVRRQVADRLGARSNPSGDVSQDICIGVKMSPGLIRHDKLIAREAMGDYYLDFIDHHTCYDWLSHWPDVKVIVASRSSEAWLSARLRNPLTFIPQHHCNVEGVRRPDRPVRVVGYVGMMSEIPPWFDLVTDTVTAMGLEMRWFTDFQDRQDVVRAYDQIDIQFAWREGMPEKLLWTKNPLKVLNAGAFAIPTVAKEEPGYDYECPGAYAPCRTLGEAFEQIAALRDPSHYAALAERAWAVSQPYHLDTIADAFRRLADA